MDKGTLIIFAKAPIPGQAKTRLIPGLGSGQAAELHRRLVLHTLETATRAQICPVELWCTPSTDHPFFQACSQQFDITLHTQHGTDLGKRMSHAINSASQHSRYVILIGTDCPSLTINTLQQARDVLKQDTDTVIAPASDGGYVLIGVKRSSPDLFDGITWGSDTVMQITRNRLKQLGWQWHELAEHQDIDCPEDLEHLSTNQTLRSLSIPIC